MIMGKKRLKDMKKKCLFVFILLLAVNYTIVEAQTMFARRFQSRYGFGIKAGTNIATQYSPDNNGVFEVKSIPGLNVGANYNYFFHRVLAIQSEISVSGKGSHWKEYYYAQDEKKDILTYIDIPVLIRYQPLSNFNVHAGPQVSYLFRAMQYDYKTRLKTVIEDYYKPFDFGMVLGVEANLPYNIDLTVRYVRGLVSVDATGGYNYKSFNNYLQLTAGYRFEKDRKLQSKTKYRIKRRS
jgi:hypothetical protein